MSRSKSVQKGRAVALLVGRGVPRKDLTVLEVDLTTRTSMIFRRLNREYGVMCIVYHDGDGNATSVQQYHAQYRRIA